MYLNIVVAETECFGCQTLTAKLGQSLSRQAWNNLVLKIWIIITLYYRVLRKSYDTNTKVVACYRYHHIPLTQYHTPSLCVRPGFYVERMINFFFLFFGGF